MSRFQQVRPLDSFFISKFNADHVEFDQKRESAVSTHQRLQDEAQAVLDVIENPDVAQALRQDKNQNLQYLKDNYNVCCISLRLRLSLMYPGYA